MDNILKEQYERDFAAWIEQTIQSLQNRDFESLDIEHLIEELTDLGKTEKNILRSNLMVLLTHLLELRVQYDAPETMKSSWYSSVLEHRQRVFENLNDNPSLKSFLREALEKAYPNARKIAVKEGKFAKFGVRMPEESEYPASCPFSLEQVLDEDFYGI